MARLVATIGAFCLARPNRSVARIAVRAAGLLLLLPMLGSISGCAIPKWWTRSNAAEAAGLCEQARDACEEGNDRQAASLLDRAVKVAPKDAEIHRELGELFLMSGEESKGIKHLDYAAQSETADTEVQMELARVLFDSGRFADCERPLDAIIRAVPTHAEAWLMKGKLAEARHDDVEARAIYYWLLGLQPRDIEAKLRIAGLLLQEGHGSQAAPLARAVIEADGAPRDALARAHWILGQVYARQRRWREAADELTIALQLRGDANSQECYQLAYASWHAGDEQVAREHLSRALAIDGGNADARAMEATIRRAAAKDVLPTAHTPPPFAAPRGW